MEIFVNHLRKLWNKWELRVLVLLSLTWQVILIIFGSQRKYRKRSFVSSLVWLTYLSADWLATVSLGTLANSQGDNSSNTSGSHSQTEDKSHVLKALWAPFLLLHLGGPDTISAFSLEDNSLWLRHLLGLLVQVSVAFYIFLRSWSSSALTFIAIPVFISGIIKYSERTWVLRSASPDQFEDSLISTPTMQPPDLRHIPADSEREYVHKGYSLFPLLKRLYANLSLRFAQGRRSYNLVVWDDDYQRAHRDPDDKKLSCYAFKLVEVQLGFLYDVLYTKATIIYSLGGLIFRFISIFSISSALIAFFVVVIDNKHGYSRVDIFITYVLFIGAVALEIYAFVSLIFSDWTMRWLTKTTSPLPNFINSVISCCRSTFFWCTCRSTLSHQKRWSESMAQHNLVSFSLKNRVIRCIESDLLFKIYFMMELYWQRTWKRANDNNIKELIFEQLREKHTRYKESGYRYNVLKELLSYKGNNVLENRKCDEVIRWSVEVEFDHSLVLWHVATDICYYSTPGKEGDTKEKCEASKQLSDYMLYILLMRPFMLPKWIDRVTHVRDTFREAISLFHRRQFPLKDCAEACKILIQVHTQHQPLEQVRKEKGSKSVLLDACLLASQLQKLQNSWDIICQVWIEMLTYAASHCEWEAHAHQLRRGGEFLTHVGVLMANLGLNEQFDVGRRGAPTESKNEGWGWVRCKLFSPN